jgi:hypothetical protein
MCATVTAPSRSAPTVLVTANVATILCGHNVLKRMFGNSSDHADASMPMPVFVPE